MAAGSMPKWSASPHERTYLMPSAELHGLLPNARVVPSARRGGVEVGEGLLGRVIDSDGVPLDGKGPIRAEGHVGMVGVSINPLAREPITQPLDVGVRAINALLPIGRGQRVGLFMRLRRRQVDAAGHDDPLHRRRCDRGRPDR